MNLKPSRSYWKLSVLGILVFASAIGGLVWWQDQHRQGVFDRGIQAFESKDNKGLAKACEQLKAYAEYEPHRHLLQGLSLWREGKSAQALAELGNALGHDETTGRALVYSGQILISSGDHPGGVQMFQAALEVDSKLIDAHRNLVAAYYDVGAMENSLQHIAKVIELAPDDMRPWRMRGLIYKDFERFDEAVTSYVGCLARNPSEQVKKEVQGELAESLFQLRRFDESISYLKQLEPTAKHLALMAECLLALGRNDEATIHLDQALALDSTNPRAMNTKATLLVENGEKQAAATLLERAIQLHPMIVEFRSSLMLVYQQLGENEKAEIQQQEMKKLRDLRDRFHQLHIQSIQNVQDFQVRVELARTAVQLRMYDAAVSWYQAALSMSPNNSQIASEFQNLMNQINPSELTERNL